jgi:hypothetical protein
MVPVAFVEQWLLTMHAMRALQADLCAGVGSEAQPNGIPLPSCESRLGSHCELLLESSQA